MAQLLEWDVRNDPLAPAGVVALGPVARRLLLRLQEMPAEALASLSVVATRDMLVLIGRNELLPWVDGVGYCAPDPVVPSLWFPTLAVPRLAPDLIQASLANRVKRSPMLLWNQPEQILPLDAPISLTVKALDWLIRELD